MYYPFPVMLYEFVPKWVGLNTLNKSLHVIFLIQPINCPQINPHCIFRSNFPQFDVSCQLLKLNINFTNPKINLIGIVSPIIIPKNITNTGSVNGLY